MRAPETLAQINGELRRRYDAGRSVDVIDVEPMVLCDDTRGLFLLLTLHFADGDDFTIDTQEVNAVLRKVLD